MGSLAIVSTVDEDSSQADQEGDLETNLVTNRDEESIGTKDTEGITGLHEEGACMPSSGLNSEQGSATIKRSSEVDQD